mmetsp:Transcript_5361/g.20337  ORF Transcript_5361/g.20337 Transcript_5361/m.20337 type:complete len:236 (+) Transcript_5361:1101-1808(+)
MGQVQVAPHQAQRPGQALQVRPGIGCGPHLAGRRRGERAAVHREEQVPSGTADAALGLTGAVQPQPGLQAVHLGAVTGRAGDVDRGVQRLGRTAQHRHRRTADRRRHQRQPCHAFRPRQREVDRDAAALRAADQLDTIQPQRIQHRAQVVDPGMGPGRADARLTKAAAVHAQRGPLPGRSGHGAVPHAAVAHAGMEKDQGRATIVVRAVVDGQLGGVDRNPVRDLHRAQPGSAMR